MRSFLKVFLKLKVFYTLVDEFVRCSFSRKQILCHEYANIVTLANSMQILLISREKEISFKRSMAVTKKLFVEQLQMRLHWQISSTHPCLITDRTSRWCDPDSTFSLFSSRLSILETSLLQLLLLPLMLV